MTAILAWPRLYHGKTICDSIAKLTHVKRKLPIALPDLLKNWLKNSFSSVKWGRIFSYTFAIKFGIRQGSVLSPFLFAIYLDDIPTLTPRSFIVLYADDILLIAPSINELQSLFRNCEIELRVFRYAY